MAYGKILITNDDGKIIININGVPFCVNEIGNVDKISRSRHSISILLNDETITTKGILVKDRIISFKEVEEWSKIVEEDSGENSKPDNKRQEQIARIWKLLDEVNIKPPVIPWHETKPIEYPPVVVLYAFSAFPDSSVVNTTTTDIFPTTQDLLNILDSSHIEK